MTPTPYSGWMHYICCVRIHALTYFLTQLDRAYIAGNISETVEDRAKAIINGLYKVIVWLSIAAKMYDLE